VVLSVTPSVLADGEDAFVSYSGVANPTPQDYISVSCGDTNGLNDFIDATYVGNPNLPGSITNVCLFVCCLGAHSQTDHVCRW
jgi:hypothetical protein